MGCDIHVFVEARIGSAQYPTWQNIDSWAVNQGFGSNGVDAVIQEKQIRFRVCSIISYYRDYELFTILAGVRETGGITPIAFPKGLPPDASTIVKIMESNLGEDAHSHSFLTLRELKESIYSKETPIRAWIHKEDKKDIVGGKGQFIHYKDYQDDDYVYAEWSDEPNQNFLFMLENLERMKNTHKINDDNDIRIVFWFDT